MGCDIHLFTEKKIKNVWVDQKTDLDINRNYTLFSILANVRNENNIPFISKPKGSPVDASIEYFNYYILKWELDGHSHSYLNMQELEDYFKLYPEITEGGMISLEQNEQLNKGILPTSWCGYTSDNTYVYAKWGMPNMPLQNIIEKLRKILGSGNPEDIRIVFFFDN